MSRQYGQLVSPMDEVEDEKDPMDAENDESSDGSSSDTDEIDTDAFERRAIELKNMVFSISFEMFSLFF